MNNTKTIAGILIGLGLGVVIAFGLLGIRPFQQPNDDSGMISQSVGPIIDEQAPNFELESVEGEPIELKDYQGKVVLINFWATWCAPCRLEMPDIQTQSELHSDDLRVIAVNFDETPEDVLDFVSEMGLTFDVVLDPGAEVQQLYRVRGYPSSYFVDRDGILRIQHIGIMTENQLAGYLDQLGLQ